MGVADLTIEQALAEVNSTAHEYLSIQGEDSKSYGANIDMWGNAAEARTNLIRRVYQLYQSVKGPADMVHHHFETVAHTGAVRALLEMGVFEALPKNGESKTAQQLAGQLGVEKLLLVRLMRFATVLGPFAEVGKEVYAHTPYSLAYLDLGLKGIFRLTVDEYAPAKVLMYKYFSQNGWRVPTSTTQNPYTFAHNTGGVGMWEWMSRFPERLESMNWAMATATEQAMKSVAIYPFEKKISQLKTYDSTPLVVDVGGGRGHAAQKIREILSGVPGRVVLQDRLEGVSEVKGKLSGVETMAYDFFTPQPVQGALVYFLRRVLHDWPDSACIQIIKVIAEAMNEQSRLVISEILVPEVDADPEACWVDMTMLTFSGTERTAAQFAELLSASGLELVSIHTRKGTNYAAVEGRLKQD